MGSSHFEDMQSCGYGRYASRTLLVVRTELRKCRRGQRAVCQIQQGTKQRVRCQKILPRAPADRVGTFRSRPKGVGQGTMSGRTPAGAQRGYLPSHGAACKTWRAGRGDRSSSASGRVLLLCPLQRSQMFYRPRQPVKRLCSRRPARVHQPNKLRQNTLQLQNGQRRWPGDVRRTRSD